VETFKNLKEYDNKRKMKKMTPLTKFLSMGLITAAIGMHPSFSYTNLSQFYSRLTEQEKKIPTKVRGEELQKIIIQEELNTGRFSSEQVVEMIEKSIQKVGSLPEYMDEGTIYSFVDNESSWNPRAKSKKGARGLGQITKDTWKTYNPKVSYSKVYEPVENLETTVKVINGHEEYFEKMHPRWEDLPKEEKLKIHAAAYNWGKGNLKKIGWDLEKQEKRIPRETKRHIKKILRTYEALSS